jgi:hypothetical protein
MYLIYKEFDWFIEQRQVRLEAGSGTKYAIFVQSIPHECFRNNVEFIIYSARPDGELWTRFIWDSTPSCASLLRVHK